MTSPDATQVGVRLDEDHNPETNGRMAVCRRCGARTDSPEATRHRPDDRRLERAARWLEARARDRQVSWAQERSSSRVLSPSGRPPADGGASLGSAASRARGKRGPAGR